MQYWSRTVAFITNLVVCKSRSLRFPAGVGFSCANGILDSVSRSGAPIRVPDSVSRSGFPIRFLIRYPDPTVWFLTRAVGVPEPGSRCSRTGGLGSRPGRQQLYFMLELRELTISIFQDSSKGNKRGSKEAFLKRERVSFSHLDRYIFNESYIHYFYNSEMVVFKYALAFAHVWYIHCKGQGMYWSNGEVWP